MNLVIAVAAGIPAWGNDGLSQAAIVGGASPDFVVALLGQLQGDLEPGRGEAIVRLA